MKLKRWLSISVLLFFAPLQGELKWPQLNIVEIVAGAELPVHITHTGDQSGRLYVVEQKGTIRFIEYGSLYPAPFLDIRDRVRFGGERGLLCVAFPPNYKAKKHFYVNYTRFPDGNTIVSRFSLSENPDEADPESEEVILSIPQPYSNHNGGQLAFGLDGYLYIGTGDG